MKTISKLFQYTYLVFAAYMLYQTIIEYKNNGTRVWLYGLFCLAAIAMFFFKRHFNKKFQQ